jgi:hypothetical protein
MKEATLEQLGQDLAGFIEAAQHERILVIQDGEPVAMVVGLMFKDEEDLRLEQSREFWEMIEAARKRPTVRLKDIEAELFPDEP